MHLATPPHYFATATGSKSDTTTALHFYAFWRATAAVAALRVTAGRQNAAGGAICLRANCGGFVSGAAVCLLAAIAAQPALPGTLPPFYLWVGVLRST